MNKYGLDLVLIWLGDAPTSNGRFVVEVNKAIIETNGSAIGVGFMFFLDKSLSNTQQYYYWSTVPFTPIKLIVSV